MNTSKSINIRGVCDDYLNGYSRTSFWRLRDRDKTFPKSFTVGGNPLWHRQDVQAWYDKVRGVSASVNILPLKQEVGHG